MLYLILPLCGYLLYPIPKPTTGVRGPFNSGGPRLKINVHGFSLKLGYGNTMCVKFHKAGRVKPTSFRRDEALYFIRCYPNTYLNSMWADEIGINKETKGLLIPLKWNESQQVTASDKMCKNRYGKASLPNVMTVVLHSIRWYIQLWPRKQHMAPTQW